MRYSDVFSEADGAAAQEQAKTFAIRWKDEKGVADIDRQLFLDIVRAEPEQDNAAVERAISEIVSNSPSGDIAWQKLAQARLANGKPMVDVLAAFHMSDLFGSHDGPAMVGRALFGLKHWAELPQTDRKIVARDAAATYEEDRFDAKKQYREIILSKAASERESIREALKSSGFATPAFLQAIEKEE